MENVLAVCRVPDLLPAPFKTSVTFISLIPTSFPMFWLWKVLGLNEGIQPFVSTRGNSYDIDRVLFMV